VTVASGAHSHPPRIGAALVILCAGGVAWAWLSRGGGHAVRQAGQAATRLAEILLIAGACVLGLAVIAGAVIAWRALRPAPRQVERGWSATVERNASRSAPRDISPAPDRHMPGLAAGPSEVHYHVHLPEGADLETVRRLLP
jgi:hypothetical protein